MSDNRALTVFAVLAGLAVVAFVVNRARSPQSTTLGDVTSNYSPGITPGDLAALRFGLEDIAGDLKPSGGATVGDKSRLVFRGNWNGPAQDVSLDAVREVFNINPLFGSVALVKP